VPLGSWEIARALWRLTTGVEGSLCGHFSLVALPGAVEGHVWALVTYFGGRGGKPRGHGVSWGRGCSPYMRRAVKAHPWAFGASIGAV
jgi:hypothetical protein